MAALMAMRVVTAGWLIAGAVCVGQTYTPPPPLLTTLPPCPAASKSSTDGADAKAAKKAVKKAKDCDPTNLPVTQPVATSPVAPSAGPATEKFPFPGEAPASAPAAQRFPFPGESSATQTPAQPTVPPVVDPTAPETPAGKRFPFPGEAVPAAAPETATAPGSASASSDSDSDLDSDLGSGSGSGSASEPPASSSSASTKTSSSSDDLASRKPASGDDAADDDDQPKLTDKGSEGARGSRRNKRAVMPQTDTQRVDEDLNVARFYEQSGNAMGAYLRARDAVKTQPDYPEAHFVLGEAAKRLNKRDEAKAEFSAYLRLAPDGQRAKSVEKALAELE